MSRCPRVLAALAVLLGLLGASAGLAAPAAGHDSLAGSDPADGSTVGVPPTSIALTFSEPPLGIGAEVRVTGPDGAPVGDGDLVLTGTTVSQPLAAELPAGAYTVVWRVTSSDGHPISGELSFTATAGTASAATPTAPGEPTGEPTVEVTEPAPEPEASQDPPGPGVADPADATAPADVAGEDDASGSSSALPWALGGVVLLAAAGAAWWAARRRSGPGTSG